jgi:hypothetical protein
MTFDIEHAADKLNGQLHGRATGYVVPYVTILKEVNLYSSNVPGEVRLSVEQFQRMIKGLLRGVSVDEQWYRTTYRDVDEAIRAGAYKSAKHHFIENGYFEGRRPNYPVVDESWYMSAYKDVAEGIEFGDIRSCQQHFDEYGESEGRLPQEY